MQKLLLALALTFCVSSAFAKDIWEYKVVSQSDLQSFRSQELTQQLSKRGAQGWELVTVIDSSSRSWFFYKRKK